MMKAAVMPAPFIIRSDALAPLPVKCWSASMDKPMKKIAIGTTMDVADVRREDVPNVIIAKIVSTKNTMPCPEFCNEL